jgi:hypothetical protein
MRTKQRHQRGQALVMIALAIVGLVGFAALAIDGSSVFSDRRHSQNASDTSSLAAALALTRGETNWKDFGFQRARSNGYDPADGITKVDVYLCSELPQIVDGLTLTCVDKGLPTGANPDEYVYVHIKSRVKLFFAPLIGWREVINNTDAVARAKKEVETSMFPGFAIVSTMLDCPPAPPPFEVSGNSITTVVDAGILVNSNCTAPKLAYDQGGSSHVDTDKGVCAVGAVSATDTDPPPTTNCTPININMYTLPNPTCTHVGSIQKNSDGDWVATPGLYGKSYTHDSIDDVSPAGGKIILQKGIYCLNDGIDLHSTWTITTDIDGHGTFDPATEGALLFVPHGDVLFNGSSNIDIHAVTTTADDFPKRFLNVLIYVPPTNNPSTVNLTGGNGSQFSGTILAPASEITLNGGSSAYSTIGLDSQIIGYAVKITGSGTLDIHYNPKDNIITTTNPSLQQTE